METKIYNFNTFNNFSENGISSALSELNSSNKNLIIVCVGSDLILGDTLGPLVGTMLKSKNVSTYIYGTLNMPITAKEIEHVKTHLKQMHPNSLVLAIDAAIGEQNDVGLIKLVNKGLKPGLGVDKKLGSIGDISIIGIVATKSLQNYNLYNLTRFGLVYKMAEKIANGIEIYSNQLPQSQKQAL